MGRLWKTSRQIRLLCPWARHLMGRPTFMWKTGGPDTSEIATPKRVRTYRPKHYDTICFLGSFVLFAIFILHSRESELYRYTLDGKSALAWELPFSRFMGHLSST